ncbi:MAG: DEAD/DEAH box helicase [Nitrospirota bacterium]
MPLSAFHPVIDDWLRHRFGEPTDAQRLGWPHIVANRDTLIAAPTGSGKTLAAFLASIDRLLRVALDDRLPDQTRVLYVSPLKALSHDVERNLTGPLDEIIERAATAVERRLTPIRVAVRTGDTPAAERQRMTRRPPHIVVTTPESLYLLLTSVKGRAMLRTVETVIVDEIHAVARDKRGSHLALSLARLDALCERRPVRVGLSATQAPIDEIARFLIGTDRVKPDGTPDCAIVDVGHRRQLDLAIDVPPSDLSAVCSNEQWEEVYARVAELIAAHRSTIVFVNTRRLAERVTLRLTERLGDGAVLSHHGSLSKKIRRNTELRLKSGDLKAVVATASLELGIDVGFIDLVVQIGSPRSIAVFLQRVGRSGHALGHVPRGRLFPLTRDELMECAALIRSVRRGELDRVVIPEAPLDILAQQIVAETSCEEWPEDDLYRRFRSAWPYRNLSRDRFDQVVAMLAEGYATRVGRAGAYLHHDRIGKRIKARRAARLTALTSGGAIPELADYRVVVEPDQTVVGSVDEDFAVESMSGDIFLLGNTSWQIQYVRAGDVVVHDAHGAPPTIPFWRGEAPSRTAELSVALSDLRRELATRVSDPDAAAQWLTTECLVEESAAREIVSYVQAQLAAVGLLPTREHVLIEHFFDESGGMQLVIHSPYGGRINRAWGLALRKRFCRTFDFELQASADDDGIVLSLGPQQSFPLSDVPMMLPSSQAEHILTQAVLGSPIFATRWRWNANRALAVPRQQHGRRVPPPLQRMRSDDLMVAVFPQQMACPENLTGPDIEIPDHPLVWQTMHDCLHEACDLNGLADLLRGIESGAIAITAIDTREPSPFAYEILNANPYAFLDDAPLEERRARAVATRRTLTVESVRDLGTLDPEAIERVRREAWPLVRDADELYDALMLIGMVSSDEAQAWGSQFEELLRAGRAIEAADQDGRRLWVAVERWPLVRIARPELHCPNPPLPPFAKGGMGGFQHLMGAQQPHEPQTEEDADVTLVRGRLEVSGPIAAIDLSRHTGIPPSRIDRALLALEHEGFVLRGTFTPQATNTEWCARRLLARIHRLTLDGLRRQIEPATPETYLRFLLQWTHLAHGAQVRGRHGLRDVFDQLQGFDIPAIAWERDILPARVADYDPQWLDDLCLSGELMWARVTPPTSATGDGDRTAQRTPGRTVPLSLLARQALPWVSWRAAAKESPHVSPKARTVWDALSRHGASFVSDLASPTRLLPAEVTVALWELAASGVATQDGFAGVRALVDTKRQHRGRHRQTRTPSRGMGRWTLLSRPAPSDDHLSDEILEPWACQLLRRYGVVFRELLTREDAAPPWSRLLSVFRRLESRGEIRGGRFVAGVGGEQYALPETIEPLRRLRDAPPGSTPVIVSAADPANLVGIITPGDRVPAQAGACVAFIAGRPVGSRQGAVFEIAATLDPDTAQTVHHALAKGPTWTMPSDQVSAGSWRDELNARRRIVRLRTERQEVALRHRKNPPSPPFSKGG